MEEDQNKHMPNCDRCNKPITSGKLYSDPIIIGQVDCKDCYNRSCESLGRMDKVDN